jgi:hypothetical protein
MLWFWFMMRSLVIVILRLSFIGPGSLSFMANASVAESRIALRSPRHAKLGDRLDLIAPPRQQVPVTATLS